MVFRRCSIGAVDYNHVEAGNVADMVFLNISIYFQKIVTRAITDIFVVAVQSAKRKKEPVISRTFRADEYSALIGFWERGEWKNPRIFSDPCYMQHSSCCETSSCRPSTAENIKYN